MNFSELLAKKLKERNMTITELARRTGVPKSTIHNWLVGHRPRVDIRCLKVMYELQLYDLVNHLSDDFEMSAS